jgi:Ca-activated chloride channel homolog
MRVSRVSGLVVSMMIATAGASLVAQTPAGSGATFTSHTEVVTVSAVVRDRAGRLVPHLMAADFEVLDKGSRRQIIEFHSEPAPLSVALLFDISGSMELSTKLRRARDAAHQLLSWLDPVSDEAAIFAFDTEIQQLRPFEAPLVSVDDALASLRPFGATSLRDAIAATAQRVTARGGPRRAVVVLTDGVDTASRMTPAEVSAAASAIDVPVYIVAMVSPLDQPGGALAVDGASESIIGELSNLARWTGGTFFVASLPSHVSVAARQIVAELRQQYLIAVEPGMEPGWHPLEVRTRDGRLTVRARSGYFAGP